MNDMYHKGCKKGSGSTVMKYLHYTWSDTELLEDGLRLVWNVYCKL